MTDLSGWKRGEERDSGVLLVTVDIRADMPAKERREDCARY